jgi:hypothetical protein
MKTSQTPGLERINSVCPTSEAWLKPGTYRGAAFQAPLGLSVDRANLTDEIPKRIPMSLA